MNQFKSTKIIFIDQDRSQWERFRCCISDASCLPFCFDRVTPCLDNFASIYPDAIVFGNLPFHAVARLIYHIKSINPLFPVLIIGITNRVVNWSYSTKLLRIRIGVGVAYGSDVHRVMELMLEAARNQARVLSDPQPVCQLKNFGDHSIIMELRIWISDPENGVANVSSAVRLAIWDAFKANGIEIPFPQRVVHMKMQTQPADKS